MAHIGFERAMRVCRPAALAAAVMLPAAAMAQEAPTADETPWIKVCGTDPATKKETCSVSQQFRAENGALIAQFSIQPLEEKGKYGVSAFVPLGFRLPTGVALAVDGEKKGTAQFAICLPQTQGSPEGCAAQALLGDDFLAALRKGSSLALVLVNARDQAIPIEMTLVGFAKTFDGKGLDPTALQAKREDLSKSLKEHADQARQKLIDQQQQQGGN